MRKFHIEDQRKAGVILNYTSIAINMVVGLVYTPFLLAKLGQSEYGLYSLAASVIAYLTIFDLGFGNAIIRYTAKFKTEHKTKEIENMLGMFLQVYLLIGLAVFIAGIIITIFAENIFGENMTAQEVMELKILLILLTLNLAFTFPMSIWSSVATAYERFIFLKSLSITVALLNPLVMVVALFWGYKAIALVVVTSFFNILSLVIHCWYCRKILSVKVSFSKFDWGFVKEISVYSFWVFLTSLTDQFYWSSGQFILGIVQGTSAVAIFALALQLKNIYYTFSLAISSVFLPKVTKMVTEGTPNKVISDLFISTGRMQYLVISYILVEFFILGQPFIRLWAGTEYERAYFITLLFFISTLIPLIQNIAPTILMARNQMKSRAIIVLVMSAISLLISIPVSARYGAVGCAFVISLAIIVGYGLVLNYYYKMKQDLDTISFWKQIVYMSFVPMIMIIAYKLFIPSDSVHSWIDLIIVGGITTILFVPLAYHFSMNDAERKLIHSLIQKINVFK